MKNALSVLCMIFAKTCIILMSSVAVALIAIAVGLAVGIVISSLTTSDAIGIIAMFVAIPVAYVLLFKAAIKGSKM